MKNIMILPLCFVLFLGTACSEPAADSIAESTSESPVAPDVSPGSDSAAAPPAGLVPEVPPGAGTGASGLTWDVPETWTEETPSSSMRRAQYRVPGPAGDAECVVFYFGPGQGGDVESNIGRWVGQFTLEDGRPASEQAQRSQFSVGEMPVTMVEVAGIYSGGMPMQPADPQPGSALLGAIVEGPDANWFYKMTGPKETVQAAAPAFRALVESVRPGTE